MKRIEFDERMDNIALAVLHRMITKEQGIDLMVELYKREYDRIEKTGKKVRTKKMECECGFEFSGPGESRNCEAFVHRSGQNGVICPACGNCYVSDEYVSNLWLNESEG